MITIAETLVTIIKEIGKYESMIFMANKDDNDSEILIEARELQFLIFMTKFKQFIPKEIDIERVMALVLILRIKNFMQEYAYKTLREDLIDRNYRKLFKEYSVRKTRESIIASDLIYVYKLANEIFRSKKYETYDKAHLVNKLQTKLNIKNISELKISLETLKIILDNTIMKDEKLEEKRGI